MRSIGFLLVSVLGLIAPACGSSSSTPADAGAPGSLSVDGTTWALTSPVSFIAAKGSDTLQEQITSFTLTMSESGGTVSYAGTQNDENGDVVTWSCSGGTLSGSTITFSNSCTVTAGTGSAACTATLSRTDTVDDSTSPWTLTASPYAYTWSGSGCTAEGFTQTIAASYAMHCSSGSCS